MAAFAVYKQSKEAAINRHVMMVHTGGRSNLVFLTRVPLCQSLVWSNAWLYVYIPFCLSIVITTNGRKWVLIEVNFTGVNPDPSENLICFLILILSSAI